MAIATTIYRLLMEMDSEGLEDFERSKNAFINDSRRAGVAAIIAAGDGAFEAGSARGEGHLTMARLWDMAEIFDTINFEKLF